jgi:hypothetical protein
LTSAALNGPAEAKGPRPISDLAKIADSFGKSGSDARVSAGTGNKKVLTVSNKQLTEAEPSLGTDNALRPLMPTPVTPAHAVSSGSTGGSSAVLLQPETSSSHPSADTALLAHRAVDAVMNATENVDAGNRSAVRLQFSVGDASLSVHVELRAGEIHTTFRTDSSDLRSALAHEWQAVSSDPARAVRLADPVFAPATAQGHTSGFGEGSARQRHPGERDASGSSVASFPSTPARASARPESAPAQSPATLPANLNLYTFA